jgi:hypothetical protein
MPPATPTLPEPEETAVPTLSTERDVTVEPDAEKAVAAAKADLVGRLGVTEEDIVVKSVEAIQWRDTSLGCPQLGMIYAQVITPGFRVVLEVEGQAYEYHTDGGQSVVLCEEESMTDTPTTPSLIEPGLDSLISLAKEDLAQRLSIQVEQIEVLEAKSVVWPDSSLGCPQPGMRYRQVPMDGARIRLAVEGRVYAYHSGGGRGPFLCEQTLEAPQVTPKLDELLPPPGSEVD